MGMCVFLLTKTYTKYRSQRFYSGHACPTKKLPREILALCIKDLNWLHRQKTLKFWPEKFEFFVPADGAWCRFSQQQKIMDYSLLVIYPRKGNRDTRDTTSSRLELLIEYMGVWGQSKEPRIPAKTMRGGFWKLRTWFNQPSSQLPDYAPPE
jgi:hypothetical protein